MTYYSCTAILLCYHYTSLEFMSMAVFIVIDVYPLLLPGLDTAYLLLCSRCPNYHMLSKQ